jgi:lysophospholipase L1-like esterase
MRYQLAAIGLAPFLIAQGLYVRLVTPRLPEAEGLRSGINGSGPPLSLLILGDSAAAGVGVSTQSQALSGQLVSALGSDFRVSWKLIAQTGHKAKEVAEKLVMATPEKFDFVVTSIGLNDVTHGTKSHKWIDQQGQIIELLLSKFQSQYIILSSIPPIHLFPALPQPLRWYLGMRAKRFNNALEKFVKGCNRCELVTINFPLDRAYIAEDGFHPGALAYSIWANHVAGIIRNRLAVTLLRKGQKKETTSLSQ